VDGSNGTNCVTAPYECWDPTGVAPWQMDPPGLPNLAHIGRDLVSEGEYIWKDASSDERTDFGAGGSDAEIDLLEFRITGDRNNLYFYARFVDLTVSSGTGAAQLLITLDMDRITGSGIPWLAGFSETNVSDEAAWEYHFLTRFGSGNTNVEGFDPRGNPFFVGLSALSKTNEVIEVAVPWSAMDLHGPPSTPLRFTVAVARADINDNTCDPEFGLPCQSGINGSSDVMDAVTNYGDPGLLLDTWSEVQDDVIDYYFDVFFEPDGDVVSPVLITEVFPDPIGPEPQEEWVEIINNTISPIALNTYKIGDEEMIDAGEGMFRFPSGVLDSGEQAVIANHGDDFEGLLAGLVPNYAIVPGGTRIPTMVLYDLWATGTMNISNAGDEILVLDPFDTVVDVVITGTGAWPGVYCDGTVPNQAFSVERRNLLVDTNVIFDGSSPSPDFETSLSLLGNPMPGDIDAIELSCPAEIDEDASGFTCAVTVVAGTGQCQVGSLDTCGGTIAPDCSGDYVAVVPQGEAAGPGSCEAVVEKGPHVETDIQELIVNEVNQAPYFTSSPPVHLAAMDIRTEFSYNPTWSDDDLPDQHAGDPGLVSCVVTANTCGPWLSFTGCDAIGTPDGDCSYELTISDSWTLAPLSATQIVNVVTVIEDPIFADGFETGDTTQWSASTPQ